MKCDTVGFLLNVEVILTLISAIHAFSRIDVGIPIALTIAAGAFVPQKIMLVAAGIVKLLFALGTNYGFLSVFVLFFNGGYFCH
jgi:hypothetical protein